MSSNRKASPLLGLLASVTTTSLIVALIAGWGWYRASHRTFGIRDLSEDDRRRLLEEAMAINPGIYEHAWFQPRIAYTLEPETELEAWNDRFTSNEIGYRTGSVHKPEGAYRILFVGDSWAYGMGVREQESFPRVLERLAARHAGTKRVVETFTLALPGYNTVNETAALWFYFGRLEPDAVVFVPSSNDNQSSNSLLPDGSLHAATYGTLDDYGDPHHVAYRIPSFCPSYRSLDRWRQAFDLLRDAEERLAAADIPTFFFFVARWQPEIVHHFVAQAGITSPYTVVPTPLTLGEWLNDNEVAHGNPAANERYAQLLYRLLAPRLGWSALPDEVLYEETATTPLFEAPPAGTDWSALAYDLMEQTSRRQIAPEVRVRQPRRASWVGPGNPASGVFGQATTVIVRRRQGTTALAVTVRRLEEVAWIYPLELVTTIPSPAGGESVRTVVAASGPPRYSFEVPVPADLDDYLVLDLQLEAEVVGARDDERLARSLALESVLQVSP